MRAEQRQWYLKTVPYQGPAIQVFPHLWIRPLGLLRLCLSDGTQPSELRFEGPDPGVCEEVLHGDGPSHPLRKMQ